MSVSFVKKMLSIFERIMSPVWQETELFVFVLW